MSVITVRLSGIEELDKFIKDFGSTKRGGLVHDIAQQIRNAIIVATPYDSGIAKTSWGQIEEHAGGYAFSSGLGYINPLAFGSEKGQAPWPSAGPKTVANSGRIFSKQAPEGIIEEANLEQVIENCIDQFIKGLTSA